MQCKDTLWLDSNHPHHCLGPFPNTPNKTRDWKSSSYLNLTHVEDLRKLFLSYPEAYL